MARLTKIHRQQVVVAYPGSGAGRQWWPGVERGETATTWPESRTGRPTAVSAPASRCPDHGARSCSSSADPRCMVVEEGEDDRTRQTMKGATLVRVSDRGDGVASRDDGVRVLWR
jgi:hypothetical protein